MHAFKLCSRLDLRLVLLALFALAVAAIGASSAGATLSAVGPTSQATGGFPRYFTDSTNTRLELCLDQSGNCLAVMPDPASPPGLPDNFPDESFWWDGTADVPIPGPNGTTGQALLIMATEAAFANEVADGEQIAFSRIRLRIRGGIPNQDYTFTYPYGSRKLRTDSNGGVSFTSDIGCFTFPCDWSQVLRGEIGPWLKWNPNVAPAAPAGYLGDPNVLHSVVGSPTGNNLFRVNGGGNTLLPQPTNTSPGGVQTTQFAIQGKLDTGPEPPPPGPAEPAASFVPTSLAYAPRSVGTTSAAQNVTLTNSGTGPMTISSVALTGANAGDFAITSNTCPAAPATLAANAGCTVSVTFTPAASGARSADVTFTDDAAGSPHKVPLSGTGNGVAASVSPTSMTFSAQTGTTSAAQVATLTNTGNQPMTISGVSLTGVDAASYDIVSNGCPTAAGTTLAGGASCQVSVAFAPSTTGTKTAQLSFADNAPGSPHTVGLTGTATAPPPASAPAVTLSPTSLTFASRDTGTTSPSQPVTLTNSGTGPLTITSIVASGDFARTTDCPAAPATLAAGAVCTINVTFSPTAAGARSGAITITDDAPGSPHSVALSGTGTTPTPPAGAPGITITPTSLAFGDQATGTVSALRTVTVANPSTATAPLVIGTTPISGADFSVNTATSTCAGASVPVGGSCKIDVRFSPGTTGAKSGTLTINDNAAGNPHSVTLSGNGVVAPAPAIDARPNPLLFGDSRVPGLLGLGATTVTKSVTVTNTGTANLTFGTISIGAATTSSAPGDYAITGNTCTSARTPNATCTITIRFGARARGVRNATLIINSNAPTTPTRVALQGNGI